MADETPGAPEPRDRTLGKSVVRGITWTAVGTAVSNLGKLAVLAALGRLLSPTDFGTVAVATGVMIFANAIRDLGVGSALVQHRDPGPAHLRTAFTVSLALTLVLAALTFAGAELLADAYNAPAAAPVIAVIAVLFLIRGVGTVPTQMARRAMRFRALTLLDLGAYLVGSAVSIAAAVAGAGPWSLVAGYLAESLLNTAGAIYLQPPPLRLGIDRPALRELLTFGGGQTVGVIANVIAVQGDNFVVSRSLGEGPLGFYTRAYELVQYPGVLFSNVVGSVLFPALSRLQDDVATLAQVYRRILFANAVVLLPGSAGLVLLAPEFVRILMGPGWDGAVLPFQVLAISMLFRTSYKVGVLVVRARGDVYAMATTQIIYAVLVVGGALLVAPRGLTWVAATTSLAVFANFLLLCCLAARRVGMPMTALASCHLPGLVAAVVTLGAAIPAAHLLRAAHMPAPVVVVATAAAGAATFAAYAAWSLRRGDPLWTWGRGVVRQVLRRDRKAKRASPTAQTR
jgi:PST family polysaccharide transporter